MIRSFFISALAAGLLLAAGAQAASWPTLPAACTPDRAQRYDGGRSANAQAACHCPPQSYCPKNYDEYSNPTLAKMPTRLINQCCPQIDPPTCPAGSYYANQPRPANGNCNPTLCPAGTPNAGEPVDRQPNGDCGTCPNGNCDPQPVACPQKYYPTLAEAGLPATGLNPNSTGRYQYRNGQVKNFTNGYLGFGDGSNAGLVGSMADHYGYSLRQAKFGHVNGVNGVISEGNNPDYGLGLWILGPTLCDMWGFLCTFREFYGPYSGGVNDGYKTLSTLVQSMGRDQVTWYGLSVVKTDRLANNLMSDAMMSEWGGRDRVQIGDVTAIVNGAGARGGYTTIRAGAVLENEGRAMLTQCRSAGGEYVELERVNTGGQQCAYLQCRYVYMPDGMESCLSGNVKVTLADGSSKPVKELKLGDVVKGADGDHKIVAANAYQSALRVMWGINGGGALLTGDHPLRTKDGWKVMNPEAAKLYADKPGFVSEPLKVGDVLVTDKGEVAVKSIERHAAVDPMTTYNIKIEGNAGFFANGIEVKGFDKMEMKYE